MNQLNDLPGIGSPSAGFVTARRVFALHIWGSHLMTLPPQVCADTIVGSHIRRGISGGQKKRVTTGEIVVGPCKVLLMDEISVRSFPASTRVTITLILTLLLTLSLTVATRWCARRALQRSVIVPHRSDAWVCTNRSQAKSRLSYWVQAQGLSRCTRGCETGQIEPLRLLQHGELTCPERAQLCPAGCAQTGLDSSTTFQIVRSIANVAHFRDATILVSLLQARSLVFGVQCMGCLARFAHWARRISWRSSKFRVVVGLLWLGLTMLTLIRPSVCGSRHQRRTTSSMTSCS